MSGSKTQAGKSDDYKEVLSYTATELSVQEYVEARSQEMMAMTKAAKTVMGNNQPLQKLPRHMRRRAASHNVKRLPRKMQSWAKRENEKAGNPSTNKRPSRKHRRRPKNLLEEYNRRKRRNVWLETHIWHAKRFHMIEKWGYKIPLHPNDKGARAAYRASAKYCLLQDFSYYNCIEINGPERDITDALSHLCSTDTGLTFGAKAYTKGTREGHLMVYHYDQYPLGAIGPVKFVWRYVGEHDQELASTQRSGEICRKIWIWVHPAMYMDFIKEVKVAIGVVLELDTRMLSGEVISKLSEQVVQERSLTESRICHKQLMKKWKAMKTYKEEEANYLNFTGGKKPTRYHDIFSIDLREFKRSEVHEPEVFSAGTLTVRSLKDSICRFHLTGPLSNEILQETLRVSDVSCKMDPLTESKDHDDSIHTSTDVSESTSAPGETGVSGEVSMETKSWWQCCYSDESSVNIHKQQEGLWSSLKVTESPGELPPNSVLGLTVRDPRKFLPRKKAMIQHENKVHCDHARLSPFPAATSWCPIWEAPVRADVKNKISNAEINAQRSKLLVPGSELRLSDDESRIPVLLIQNPGHQVSAAAAIDGGGTPCGLGYGSGWDVILPCGWSMPFLMNLVYRGARAAGLKEVHSIAVEAGVFSYPNCFPDTAAGREWELHDWQELQAKHERIPPAKRPNFNKLGVQAPFHYPWSTLLSDWSSYSSGVVKNEGGSLEESQAGTSTTPEVASLTATSAEGDAQDYLDDDMYVLRSKSVLRQLQKILSHSSKKTQTSAGRSPPAKVNRTCKEMSSVHQPCAESCIPEPPGGTRCLVPVQVTMVQRGHSQPFSMICLPTMDDIIKLGNDKSYGGPLEDIHTIEEPAKAKKKVKPKIPILHPQKRELPRLKTIVRTCSRHIVGFIKEGNFSYAKGSGFGLGFVCYEGLLEISKLKRPDRMRDCIVLVRNSTSLQYRFAKLHVVC